MADVFAELKQKYQPVLDVIQSEGAHSQNVNMDGSQLYLKATVKSEESKTKSGTPSRKWTPPIPT
jgi:hypothetical protein